MEVSEILSNCKNPPITFATCNHCKNEISITEKFIVWGDFTFCNEDCIKNSYLENLRNYYGYKECF